MQNHTMSEPVLQSIGTAVPPYKIAQHHHYSILESANGMTREQKLVLRRIYSKSGIEYRHSVLNEFSATDREQNELFHPSGKYESTPVSKRMDLYEQYAAPLCMIAAENCFRQLPGLNKSAITHLITFSCTGMYAPGLDIQMVEKCGLERSVERTCINFMGCYAAINALKAAYHICRSSPDAVVMIAGVELCSLHYQRSYEANQVVANALFADGAAVGIVSSKNIKATNNKFGLTLQHFYAEFEQSASNDMVWRIGDAGFDLRLTPEVPNIVRENIKPLLDTLFTKTGLTKEDIDFYAIHPGGVKILEACEQALNIAKEQNAVSYDVLRNYGNMSSVTVLFVLEQYLKQFTAQDKGKKILACAFGPGITMESMIVEIS
jgi:alpha-pyrone synthase